MAQRHIMVLRIPDHLTLCVTQPDQIPVFQDVYKRQEDPLTISEETFANVIGSTPAPVQKALYQNCLLYTSCFPVIGNLYGNEAQKPACRGTALQMLINAALRPIPDRHKQHAE